MLAIVILAGCVAAFTVLLVDKDEPKSASKSNGLSYLLNVLFGLFIERKHLVSFSHQ